MGLPLVVTQQVKTDLDWPLSVRQSYHCAGKVNLLSSLDRRTLALTFLTQNPPSATHVGWYPHVTKSCRRLVEGWGTWIAWYAFRYFKIYIWKWEKSVERKTGIRMGLGSRGESWKLQGEKESSNLLCINEKVEKWGKRIWGNKYNFFWKMPIKLESCLLATIFNSWTVFLRMSFSAKNRPCGPWCTFGLCLNRV